MRRHRRHGRRGINAKVLIAVVAAIGAVSFLGVNAQSLTTAEEIFSFENAIEAEIAEKVNAEVSERNAEHRKKQYCLERLYEEWDGIAGTQMPDSEKRGTLDLMFKPLGSFGFFDPCRELVETRIRAELRG